MHVALTPVHVHACACMYMLQLLVCDGVKWCSVVAGGRF